MASFMRNSAPAVSFLVALAWVGCAGTSDLPCPGAGAPGWERPSAAGDTDNHAEAPQAADDLARIRSLEQAATKLIEDGKIVPMADLIKQLDRTSCSLKLPAPSAKTLTPSEVYDRCRLSVLIVAGVYKCKKCNRWHAGPAGGVILTASGACVTNYHVVKDDKNHTLLAMTHDGKVYPVKEVLAASQADDAAILQLDAGGATFQPLPLAPDAPVGAAVSVLSHPDQRFYSLTRGIVSRYEKRGRNRNPATMMNITADFARGSSGGAVLDDRGALAGLVSSTSSIYSGISRMTLPGYAAGRFGTHYTAPPACAQEILGFFRTEEGSAGSRRAIRMQFRPSGGQFAGTEARSAQTAPGGIQHGERGMERRSS